jgi:hypothetical protein
MLINKCDKCGTEIEGTSLQIGFDIAYGIALCRPCAQPIVHFLKQSQLLEIQLERHGFIEGPTPRSALRYTTENGDEIIQQGNRRLHIHYEKPPSRRAHWLLFVGIGMLVALLLWVALSAGVNWWSNHQIDAQYGNPRTWQVDEVVGHGDSSMHPTHFIFMNLNAHVVIIEIPGGDVSRSRIYSGPQIFGDNAASLPVTGEFRDVNGDGKVDMIVHVGDQRIVYLNDGTEFKPQQ